MPRSQSVPLLEGKTSTGDGLVSSYISEVHRTYQAIVSGTGAVTATIEIYVSNDAVNWILMGTISLSGTTTATDGFTSEAPWKHTKAKLAEITGTGASVSAYMGV